jgi:hypothetical protein
MIMKIYLNKCKMRYLLLIPMLAAFSCSDFLDVVPDDTPTIDHAFLNRTEAESYLIGLFSYLPEHGNPGQNPALAGGDEVWFYERNMSVDLGLWNVIAKGGQGQNDPVANYYASKQTKEELHGGKALFTALSDCNIFLENIHKPYDLYETERIRWIAEVKFLKAYYHFWLFRMYGPIPIIRENVPVGDDADALQRSREPVDAVVDYICSLCDEAAEVLPDRFGSTDEGEFQIGTSDAYDLGRPTKQIALSLKALALVYAASPLFNGNPDYTGYGKDKNGVDLFPQPYDPQKWVHAAEALKTAIDVSHTADHKLYNFSDPTSGSSAAAFINNLHQRTINAMQVRGAVTEQWNREIIWGDTRLSQAIHIACMPIINTNVENDGGGLLSHSWAPTLRIIEQFYTNHGIPIEEDEAWVGHTSPESLYALRTITNDDRHYIRRGSMVDNTTAYLHFNREPRFYGSISFEHGVYFGDGMQTSHETNPPVLDWWKNFKNRNMERFPITGYFCKKLIAYQTSSPVGGGFSIGIGGNYPFPIIRLADLYLMYAEALNESKPVPDNEVYYWIDTVRYRTGLEGVVESWSNYAIPGLKNKPATQEGMREIIQRERLNELAFEGHRFWDLRRWKIAREYLDGQPIRGLNTVIEGNSSNNRPDEFYQNVTLATQRFGLKDYFFPIKVSTVIKNPNLLQSPYWDTNE